MKQDLLRQQIGMLHGGFDRLEQVLEGQAAAENNLAFLRSTVEKIETEIKKDTEESKFIELSTLTLKLINWTATQASGWGIKPSFYFNSNGKISVSETNRLLPVIMAAVKLKIKWLAKEDPLVRYESGLFPASSFGIQIESDNDSIMIYLQSDVLGLHSDASAWYDLAEMVALEEGFLDKKMNSGYGQKIQIQMPIKKTRLQALILKNADFSLAIPAQLMSDFSPELATYIIDKNNGLSKISFSSIDEYKNKIGIRVGHFKCNLVCNGQIKNQQVALNSAADWLQEDSWHRSLAVCPSEGKAEIITYVSGLELYQILLRDMNE